MKNEYNLLELSGLANDTSLNNEIYGGIPYFALEIFKGFAFSKEFDIYSLGIDYVETSGEVEIQSQR